MVEDLFRLQGPLSEPYTMLWLIASSDENELDSFIIWEHPVRKEMIQFIMDAGVVSNLNLLATVVWSFTANAFEKSIIMHSK